MQAEPLKRHWDLCKEWGAQLFLAGYCELFFLSLLPSLLGLSLPSTSVLSAELLRAFTASHQHADSFIMYLILFSKITRL